MSPVIQTLAELVAINSINPEWGGPGENGVADYVESFFSDSELEVTRFEVLPGRDNVHVRLRGIRSENPLVLEAHMDTVSVAEMSIAPFVPEIRDGKLYGRGSCDTKAGLATMMMALRETAESGTPPPHDIILAAVIDEEHAFRGANATLDHFSRHGIRPGAAIVAEPTELRAVRANKGVLRFRIATSGIAAHSSKPHLGKNAIVAMAKVIDRLDSFHCRLDQRNHPLLGAPTASIGLIEGGEQINFVPSHCTISIDRRMLPGEKSVEVLDEYRSLLDGDAEVIGPDLSDEAMETPADSALVRSASRILRSMGLNEDPGGVPFGCDATKFSRAGIPSLVFGPGSIDQAHGAVEYVDLDQVEKAFAFHRAILLEYGA